MATRTTQETVTFHHPFRLSGLDGEHPAGAYTVRIQEESIESLSFLAYRRTETSIFIPLRPGFPGSVQSVPTDARELELCLARDRVAERGDAPAAAMAVRP
jgi:hypothetical protein